MTKPRSDSVNSHYGQRALFVVQCGWCGYAGLDACPSGLVVARYFQAAQLAHMGLAVVCAMTLREYQGAGRQTYLIHCDVVVHWERHLY